MTVSSQGQCRDCLGEAELSHWPAPQIPSPPCQHHVTDGSVKCWDAGTFPRVGEHGKQTESGSLGCLNFALHKGYLFTSEGRILFFQATFSGTSDHASPPFTFPQRCLQLEDQGQELAVQNSFCHTFPLLSCISTKVPQLWPPGGRNDWKGPEDSHTGWAELLKSQQQEEKLLLRGKQEIT